jgi:hypothetical protein
MAGKSQKPPLPPQASPKAHSVAGIRAAQAKNGTAMTTGQVNAAMQKLHRRSRGDDMDYRNRPESVDALLAELGVRRGD